MFLQRIIPTVEVQNAVRLSLSLKTENTAYPIQMLLFLNRF